jgi:hypothetical protein
LIELMIRVISPIASTALAEEILDVPENALWDLLTIPSSGGRSIRRTRLDATAVIEIRVG